MVLCSVTQLLVITNIHNLPFISPLEKLIVTQLYKKLTQFYETQCFSLIFTIERQRTTFRSTQHETKHSTRISLSPITMPFPPVICSWAGSDLCRAHLLIKIFVHCSYTTCLLLLSRVLLSWTPSK
jgi:hypothetical protein